jgi:Na+/proline symporter
MTWGVTWRQWVAGLVIWVALFIVFLLFAAALGGFSEL